MYRNLPVKLVHPSPFGDDSMMLYMMLLGFTLGEFEGGNASLLMLFMMACFNDWSYGALEMIALSLDNIVESSLCGRSGVLVV